MTVCIVQELVEKRQNLMEEFKRLRESKAQLFQEMKEQRLELRGGKFCFLLFWGLLGNWGGGGEGGHRLHNIHPVSFLQ